MAEYPGYHNANGDSDPNHHGDNDIVENAEAEAKSRLAKITSKLVWLVPIIAFSTLVHSVIRLILGDNSETLDAANQTIESTTRLPDAYICLGLSLVTLTYWSIRDGWSTAIKGVAMLKQIKAQINRAEKDLRAEQDARLRAKTLAEGIARGRALERQDLGLPPKNQNRNEDTAQ